MSLVRAFVAELRNDPDALAELRALVADIAPAMIDAHEYAERRGIHPKTVMKAAREGRIDGAQRVGRYWSVPADASIAPVGRPAAVVAPRRSPRRPAPATTTTAMSAADAIRG